MSVRSDPAVAGPAREAEPGRLVRASGAITAFTALSRVTGFIRIVVVTGILGTTALGNTYESSNTIPNLLFELVAAGALQAVLIPTLLELLDSGDREEAQHVAGSVLGLTAAALAAVAAVAALAAPLLLRVVFAGVSDPSTRADQVRLGTIFLWFFLPQVVCYVGGMVATAALNAQHRFAVPAAAPALNNFVVIGAYLGFAALRHGEAPSLSLTPAQIVVLAGGTTLGVVAFSALPVFAAHRAGFSLRPRFDRHHPKVVRVLRLGGWAVAEVASTQLLFGVVLVLSNHVEGGVVAYQAAFSYFLLPHALITLPIATALFPVLARRVQQDDREGFARDADRGVRAVAYVVLPAAAALTALGPLLARTLLVGHVHNGGVQMVGRTIVAFGPGLLGYGLFVLAGRLHYARHDTRTPALCNIGVVAGAGVLMLVLVLRLARRDDVAVLAWVQSGAYTLGAMVLLGLMSRELPKGHLPKCAAAVGRFLVAAALAGTAMALIGEPGRWHGRAGGLAGLALAAVVGLAVYVGLVQATGGPRPWRIAQLLRGGDGE